MMSNLKIFPHTLKYHKLPPMILTPPHCMASNGMLNFPNHALTLSRSSANILGRITTAQIVEAYAATKNDLIRHSEARPISGKDRTFIKKASQAYNQAQPLIIKPKK